MPWICHSSFSIPFLLANQISASARSRIASLKRKKYQPVRPTEIRIRDPGMDVVDTSAPLLHMHAACTHRKKLRSTDEDNEINMRVPM